MRKAYLLLFCIFILTFSTLLFLKKSNDHRECQTIQNTYTNENGKKIIEKKHDCKEIFNI